MTRDAPRETFTALRARRQAYRIATDILYDRSIDIEALDCPACHSVIHPPAGVSAVVRCGACGQLVPLPSHLRLKSHRQLTASEIAQAAEDVRLTLWAEEQAAREERRIFWMWILAVAAVVLMIWFGIYLADPSRRS